MKTFPVFLETPKEYVWTILVGDGACTEFVLPLSADSHQAASTGTSTKSADVRTALDLCGRFQYLECRPITPAPEV